jgi:hypothetical protein
VIDVGLQLDAGVAEVCSVLSNAYPRINSKYCGDGERPFAALAYGSPGLGHQGTRKGLVRELGKGRSSTLSLQDMFDGLRTVAALNHDGGGSYGT